MHGLMTFLRRPRVRATAAAVLAVAVVGGVLAAGLAVGKQQGLEQGREVGYAKAQAERDAVRAYAAMHGIFFGFLPRNRGDVDALVAERREAERAAGTAMDVADLPEPLQDRAAAAEAAGESFAWGSAPGCVTVRIASAAGGRDWVAAVPVGVAGEVMDAGAKCPPPRGADPAAGTLAERWENAIRAGEPFAYRDGGVLRIALTRCRGLAIPLPVPAEGVAVADSVPPFADAESCSR